MDVSVFGEAVRRDLHAVRLSRADDGVNLGECDRDIGTRADLDVGIRQIALRTAARNTTHHDDGEDR